MLLLIMLAVLKIEPLNLRYEGLKSYLIKVEYSIAGIERMEWFIFVVLLLFSLKGIVPVILPVSACCFISGIILSMRAAFVVNIFGVGLMMTIGFLRGRFMGGGTMYKGIKRKKKLAEYIEKYAMSNPLILLAVRAMPGVPLNTVSRIYGMLGFTFPEYLLISLGGFAPRIIVYSMLGSNIFDPFSPSFILPVSALLIFSSAALLIFDAIVAKNVQREGREEAA